MPLTPRDQHQSHVKRTCPTLLLSDHWRKRYNTSKKLSEKTLHTSFHHLTKAFYSFQTRKLFETYYSVTRAVSTCAYNSFAYMKRIFPNHPNKSNQTGNNRKYLAGNPIWYLLLVAERKRRKHTEEKVMAHCPRASLVFRKSAQLLLSRQRFLQDTTYNSFRRSYTYDEGQRNNIPTPVPLLGHPPGLRYFSIR